MNSIILPAPFNGQQIVLDAPYELQPNTPLNVVVLSEDDQKREDWYRLSAQGLARAYGDDEPEYTAADIKKWNPDYRAQRLKLEPCVKTHGYTAQTPQNTASRG